MSKSDKNNRKMRVDLILSTEGMSSAHDMEDVGQTLARICYTDKGWEELTLERPNKELLKRLLSSGHHSVFEHINLTLNLDGLSKALAMVLNNEKQYATSEKSARYTVMSDIPEEQKNLYDKWMGILVPEIAKVYPRIGDDGARETAIKKLAQENARYMTSGFTPTKMAYTVKLRQLNFLQQEFENIAFRSLKNHGEFKKRLISELRLFLKQTAEWRIPGLDNQTDRHLSLFDSSKLDVEEFYGDIYSKEYLLSFAGLAQAHRHRTINYNILDGTQKGAPLGFFVPPIVSEAGKEKEWISDLESVAKNDFPQAQLLAVYERGTLEDFRSKAMLRLCGHAQLEIMKNTLETAKAYSKFQEVYGENALKSKCQQGYNCPSPCVWTGKKSLTRLV